MSFLRILLQLACILLVWYLMENELIIKFLKKIDSLPYIIGGAPVSQSFAILLIRVSISDPCRFMILLNRHLIRLTHHLTRKSRIHFFLYVLYRFAIFLIIWCIKEYLSHTLINILHFFILSEYSSLTFLLNL